MYQLYVQFQLFWYLSSWYIGWCFMVSLFTMGFCFYTKQVTGAYPWAKTAQRCEVLYQYGAGLILCVFALSIFNNLTRGPSTGAVPTLAPSMLHTSPSRTNLPPEIVPRRY